MVADSVQKIFGMECQVVYYSACDVSNAAQRCLGSHAGSRPRHIFSDLLDRVQTADLVALDDDLDVVGVWLGGARLR